MKHDVVLIPTRLTETFDPTSHSHTSPTLAPHLGLLFSAAEAKRCPTVSSRALLLPGPFGALAERLAAGMRAVVLAPHFTSTGVAVWGAGADWARLLMGGMGAEML